MVKSTMGLMRFDDSKNNKWGTELIATYTGVAKTSNSNTNFVPDASTIFDLISYYDVNDRLSFDIGIYNIFDTHFILSLLTLES